MTIKIFMTTLCIVMCANSLKAQIISLKIGDKVPDIYLKNVRQYDQLKSARLSDYKNKLLILDFWATWCSPCLSSLPMLDSLQRKFDNQIQILSVTKENDKIIAGFYQKLYIEKNIKPISVIEDTVLNKLFPHNTIPFYVWIDNAGTVIATTESNQLNEKSIHDALNGNINNLKMRIDNPYRKLAENKSLFSLSNRFLTNDDEVLREVQDSSVLYQSVLTKYIPNIRSEIKWDSTGFKAKNVEIAFLYKTIYGLTTYERYTSLFHNKGRFSAEFDDPNILNRITNTTAAAGAEYVKWLQLNGVCYELKWGNSKKWKDRFEMLKDDLDRYVGKPMGIVSSIQKRNVQSYVLKKITSSSLLKADGGKPSEKYDAYSYSLKNAPLSQFINRLQGYFYQKKPMPFFDESGMGPVNIELRCNLSDMNSLNKELEKYGLKFFIEMRNADVLVLAEKPKG